VADDIAFVDAGEVQGPVETRALLDNPPDALRAYLGNRRF
jgi:hypothetical protein